MISAYLSACFTLFAQTPDHIPGEILLQLRPSANAKQEQRSPSEKAKPLFAAYPCISASMPIAAGLGLWKIQFDPTCIAEEELLAQVRRDPNIAFAQFNHRVELRGTTPNDPFFAQQWQWYNRGQNQGLSGLDIGLRPAWDFTTGGITAQGDSIVVGIIDTGIDTSHADLRPNLWHNHHEIPNNQRDDDGNGYIDDYRGWNSQRLNDNVVETELSAHGTGVAGMVGARGNNGVGITGVNWQVKLMPILWGGASSNEEMILRGFIYAYTQRKLYNESAGQKGAYVVAINASFGYANLRSADFPIWCAFLDSLGQQGILTVNAAGKNRINTDEVGDMPAACPSEYLVVVTNVDKTGKLMQAYGPNMVDLAAPAQDILTTRSRSNYRESSGTSLAAPQVAGAIALLYASPCGYLSDLSRNKPAEAAALARRLILEGVEPLDDLRNRVSTGGLLRVDKSIRLLSSLCATTLSTKTSQILLAPNPFQEQLLLTIRSASAIDRALLEIFNVQGQRMYTQYLDVPQDFPTVAEIATAHWPAGVYFLSVQTAGKERMVQRMVKM